MTHIPGRQYLFGREVTREQHDAAVWSNACRACPAEAGEPCTGAWGQRVADHAERTRLLVREVQDQIRGQEREIVGIRDDETTQTGETS